MKLAQYLPSTQFATMAGALLLSGGLVFAAQYATAVHNSDSTLATTNPTDTSQDDTDWQGALDAVAAASGVTAPQDVSQTQVSQLVSEAATPNLTDSVGKSLVINLAAASAQGLDDDADTQNQIIAQAAAEASTTTPPAYSGADLTIVADSKDTLHVYGNAVPAALAANPDASSGQVLAAVGFATDYQDASRLQPLQQACPAYAALAADLATIPVPQSLAPLHLEAINAVATMAAACTEIEQVITDPVQGLAGLQQFEASSDEATRVFTSIAQNLNSDGILFSKDEPGSAWSAFSSASAQ